METSPIEISKNVLTVAANIGRFVFDRLVVGGGWSDLPHEPQAAHIEYFSTPEK